MANQDEETVEKAEDQRDPYGFFKMQPEQLRKVIINIMKETFELEEEKKDYVASVNEIVKENKGRVKSAFAALKQLESVVADAEQEARVADFLKTVPGGKVVAQ